MPTRVGRTSAAATTRTTPCTAATTLAHGRGGTGSAEPRPDRGREQQEVARQADQQHPRSRDGYDVHAEHEDQEGVGLHVERRPQRGDRCRAPGPAGRRRGPAPARPSSARRRRERGTSPLHDCTTSAVIATTRPARTRVTALAGPSRASLSRRRPRSSSQPQHDGEHGAGDERGHAQPDRGVEHREQTRDARQYGQWTDVNRAHPASVCLDTSHTTTGRRRFRTSRTWREPTCHQRPAPTG